MYETPLNDKDYSENSNIKREGKSDSGSHFTYRHPRGKNVHLCFSGLGGIAQRVRVDGEGIQSMGSRTLHPQEFVKNGVIQQRRLRNAC